MSINFFDSFQLEELARAVALAEEIVSNFYKMSSAQWLRARYDIKSARDLAPGEEVDGPYAQVVGYKGRREGALLGSSSFDYYLICLQDGAILDAMDRHGELSLFPFLLYVMVHELIHVVRFAKFQQIYEASSHPSKVVEEEKIVHDLTREMLEGMSVPGMEKVLRYYRKWRIQPGFDKLI